MTRPTAEQIQAAREDAGLTRTQAARLIGTTYHSWMRWEKGERKMSGSRWFCWLQAVKKRQPYYTSLKAIREWAAIAPPVPEPIAPVEAPPAPPKSALEAVLEQMNALESRIHQRIALDRAK